MTLATSAGIAYQESLDGRSGLGSQPVVLIHGAGAHHLFWPPRLRRMSGEWVLSPDLPGHGQSPGPAEAGIAQSAARLRQWMTSLDLGPAVLVGHSMGSAISLEFALGWPEQVAGLILIGGGRCLPVNPWLLEATADPKRLGEAVERIIQWSFSRQAPRSLPAQAHERMLAAAPVVLHQDLTACNVFDVGERLPSLRLPTLVLCGSEDRMTPPEASQSLAETIQGAELELVEGAGHMVMLEKPEAVESRMRDFLNRWFHPGDRPA